jgi:1A family penicillin-binding protein
MRLSLTRLTIFTVLGLPALGLVTGLFHAAHTYRTFQVPSKQHLLHSRAGGIALYDRHGNQFFSFHTDGHRTVIPYSAMPSHLIQALVAAEDRTFFTHPGISSIGLARALWLNLRSQELFSGGSTLTQQLTKIILLNPHKSLLRKYHEALYALKIDRAFSKQDILEIYLNNAYFGEQTYGIETAAQTYFRKPAADLTLAESSLLVGLLPAPTTFSPISGQAGLAQKRQTYVLSQMVEENYLSPTAAHSAQTTPLALALSPLTRNSSAHHFALTVYQTLQTRFTPEYLNHAGLKVYTTLDPDWQQQAESTLRTQLPQLTAHGATNGAIVIQDVATRQIRALVGSADWHQPQFGKLNMATTPRQTGSAFKPIVYAAGLESEQMTAASLLTDYPTTFGRDYRPANYDRRYRGRVTARYALANSLNIPAVDLADKLGPSRIAHLAQQLGISTLSRDASSNLSIALGTEATSLLELTNAYTTFANQGYYQPAQFITHLENKYGQEVPWPMTSPQAVLRSETSFIISSILSDNNLRRPTFGNSLVTNIPSASKTGTTQEYRDAWTIGYTPHLSIGLWIGNSDNSPMRSAPGATTSAPLWRSLINTLSPAYEPSSFTAPPTIVQRYICPRHGLLAKAGQGGIAEYFLPGTEPTRLCPQTPPPPTPEAEPPAKSPKILKLYSTRRRGSQYTATNVTIGTANTPHNLTIPTYSLLAYTAAR